MARGAGSEPSDARSRATEGTRVGGKPMRVGQVLPALFRRTIDAGNLLLATGESRHI